MIVKQATLRIKTEPPIKAHGNSLRGYIARQFPRYDILHNHTKQGKLLYIYPRVQYRTINGEAYIVAIEEGVEIVREIEPHLETIVLNSNPYRIIQKEITLEEVCFGSTNSTMTYSFVKPWLALNKKNHASYNRLKTQKDRAAFLKNILAANFLSISKSLGYIVEGLIKVETSGFREQNSFLKGTPMLGFLGTFSVNFEIPDYWGIGKSVSRGFGTVVRN